MFSFFFDKKISCLGHWRGTVALVVAWRIRTSLKPWFCEYRPPHNNHSKTFADLACQDAVPNTTPSTRAAQHDLSLRRSITRWRNRGEWWFHLGFESRRRGRSKRISTQWRGELAAHKQTVKFRGVQNSFRRALLPKWYRLGNILCPKHKGSIRRNTSTLLVAVRALSEDSEYRYYCTATTARSPALLPASPYLSWVRIARTREQLWLGGSPNQADWCSLQRSSVL